MPLQPFADDAPKTNPWSEDRLGYRPFAERLATAIVGLDAPNGYVIGIHGAWGSGKSTALNFVHAFLNKRNEELAEGARPLKILEFSPWIISGHQDLVSGFFKVLSETLNDKAQAHLRIKHRTGRIVRAAADPVINAAAVVGMVVDPTAGAVSKAAALVASKSVGAAVDLWLKEPSLQSAYETLRSRLQDRGDRFLVIIDDIDRLTHDEIRAIMQMVKTVGRLPNVVYLLAYDRAIISSALDHGSRADSSQPGFAEKIVQQELDLPQATRSALLRILDQEVSFLTGPTPDNMRWHYIVSAGVHRWVRYPRDVSRLVNALKFAWSALEGEIDPQDLLAMEAMRLFDPVIFDWVRQNRDFLMGQGRFRMTTDEQRAIEGKLLRDNLPEIFRDQQIDVLCALFPARAKALRGHNKWGFSEPYFELAKRRGIASEAGYEAYFSLHPSSNAVPKSILDTAIAKLDSKEIQLELLREMLGRTTEGGAPMIAEYLGELQYRFLGVTPSQPSPALLDALFELSEQIEAVDWNGEMFTGNPRVQLHFLVAKLLEIWGPIGAGEALEAAFGAQDAPTLAAEIWVDQAVAAGVLKPDREAPQQLVTRERLDQLGHQLLQMIERCAADDTLSRAPLYVNIARAWAVLADPEAPREWLRSGMMSNPHFLATLSRGFLGYSIGAGGRVYSYSPNADDDLVDEEDLLAAARRHHGASNLSPDEVARIDALLRGIGQRQQERAGGE